MSTERARAEALRRQNFYFFLAEVFRILHPGRELSKAPYLEAMCFRLQEVGEGRDQRLLITVPPRYLKSVCASVALPAWLLGHDPGLKIIVASYGDDLARRHAADFRAVIESDMYRQLFTGTCVDPRANRTDEMRTTSGGGRKAVSLGGAVTGFGADLIIIDDLMKAQDARSERKREEVREYYEQTLFSRLDDKQRGRIIAIQQRLHEDDFAGYLIEKGSFTHLNLPASAEQEQRLDLYGGRRHLRRIGDLLNPAREPKEALDRIRREIGSYAYSAQYQQDAVPGMSEHLALERMTLVDHPPKREEILWVVQSWDTAVKDTPNCDFSVCTTWGWKDRWYLLDVSRARLDFPALKARALSLRDHWRADMILIEDTSSGPALVQQLRAEGNYEFFTKKVRGSKEERFFAQTDILQSDRVVFPTKAPWFEAFRRELFVFPNGRYDDQVDSVTQFLEWVQFRGRDFVNRDPVTGRPLGRPRSERGRRRR